MKTWKKQKILWKQWGFQNGFFKFLFYDAEITGEYTKTGTFDAAEEFVKAVEENPVLEGWGNKIVQIAQS